MSARMEAAFALAQHNAYVSMRNDPGIWDDSLRRALEGVLPMVWLEAQAEAIQAHRDLHPTYGSTAACGGGIGGMTLTEHCAVVCQNPKHDAAKATWHEVEMAYFESRRIKQNSEGNET